MRDNERKRRAAGVRRDPKTLFRRPPALWSDLVGVVLPSATAIPWRATSAWRAEDAADLSRLPPRASDGRRGAAPWRPDDVATDSVRMQRLLAAWGALPANERNVLAPAHPSVLAAVAAAARLRGGAGHATTAIGETFVRFVAATENEATKRAVSARRPAGTDDRLCADRRRSAGGLGCVATRGAATFPIPPSARVSHARTPGAPSAPRGAARVTRHLRIAERRSWLAAGRAVRQTMRIIDLRRCMQSSVGAPQARGADRRSWPDGARIRRRRRSGA